MSASLVSARRSQKGEIRTDCKQFNICDLQPLRSAAVDLQQSTIFCKRTEHTCLPKRIRHVSATPDVFNVFCHLKAHAARFAGVAPAGEAAPARDAFDDGERQALVLGILDQA
eukprot:6203199-Pleurochrysis_carterae.AAC.2